MIIKTVQWNIGGAKLRLPEDNPSDESRYINDNLDFIILFLKKYNPDIITLQECHSDKSSNQAEKIANDLSLQFFCNDVYDQSHLDQKLDLGQAIISRYPIKRHIFQLFKNPKLEVVRPNGDIWLSHDKGATNVLIARYPFS